MSESSKDKQYPSLIVNAFVMQAVSAAAIKERDDPSTLRAGVSREITEAADTGLYSIQVTVGRYTARYKPVEIVMKELKLAGYAVEKLFGVLHISWLPEASAEPGEQK
jgi:hypothetical protein